LCADVVVYNSVQNSSERKVIFPTHERKMHVQRSQMVYATKQ